MSRTVTASLGPHYEEFIQNCILQGRYNNASEVIRAGLRRLEEDERKIAFLIAAIQEGIDSGICEEFDPEEHLKQLKAAYHNG
jgi:antitoxin ParD1/3/4